MPPKKTLFQSDPAPTMFGPRAATVDAATQRAELINKRVGGQISSIPGLIDMTPPGANDKAIYAQGLQKFLAGDIPGAVDVFATIPHHPEARRALERIYQQVQQPQAPAQ